MIPFFPTHTVTIRRDSFDDTNDNGYGGAVDSSNVYANLLCAIYDASGNEAVIYQGDRSVGFGTARFYAGVTLQEGDVIVATDEDNREITKVFVRKIGLGIPMAVDCEWRRVQR